ncbi:MAG: hypothetical protein MUE63_04385 [Xanthomonadales bacterium]|nr:hypothetical protein [Xanthomonadales bacterium]
MKAELSSAALLAGLLLAGCASLPEDYPREQSWKLDASDTRLAQAFEAVAADHPGQSGAYPLDQPAAEGTAGRRRPRRAGAPVARRPRRRGGQ